jgi:hypothetical protein
LFREDAMAEIRAESERDDLYAVYVSDNTVICDLTKDDAGALLALFRRAGEGPRLNRDRAALLPQGAFHG